LYNYGTSADKIKKESCLSLNSTWYPGRHAKEEENTSWGTAVAYAEQQKHHNDDDNDGNNKNNNNNSDGNGEGTC